MRRYPKVPVAVACRYDSWPVSTYAPALVFIPDFLKTHVFVEEGRRVRPAGSGLFYEIGVLLPGSLGCESVQPDATGHTVARPPAA